MLYLRGILGYMIAGTLVMGVWGALWNGYGMLGGFAAAVLIIGPMWYMNHYIGLIHHDEDSSFVDMGLGIGVAGLMRDTFMNGGESFISSFPTLGLVALGAVLGGVAAALIEKDMEKKQSEEDKMESTSESKIA